MRSSAGHRNLERTGPVARRRDPRAQRPTRGFVVRLVLSVVVATALVAGRPELLAVSQTGATDSVKFAVIGDSGTGKRPQYEVAEQMTAARGSFPFQFVLMTGDNLYGRQRPQDFVVKFERPYEALLQAGVQFFASLGNHDNPANRFYEPFNLRGQRYHSFVRGPARFFVLDTNLMDQPQLTWLETTLRGATEPWRVAVFHHPLYSNARRHGPSVELRVVLEPLFLQHGLQVVFAGHEHVYERLKPQKGIVHFTQGASGQLRRGDLRRAESTAAGFDGDNTFMLVEIDRERLLFRAVTRTGTVVDSGEVARRP